MTHIEIVTITKCQVCEVEDGEEPCFIVDYKTSRGSKGIAIYENTHPLPKNRKFEVVLDGELLSLTKNNNFSWRRNQQNSQSKNSEQVLLDRAQRYYDKLASSEFLSDDSASEDDFEFDESDMDTHNQQLQQHYEILERLDRINENYHSILNSKNTMF
jgi:hypothetical protein